MIKVIGLLSRVLQVSQSGRMPYMKGSDSDYGPVYIREKGELRLIADPVNVEKVGPYKTKLLSHLKKCDSVRFCIREGDQTTSTKKNDPVFLTLCYSAKSLFDIALGFVADNVQHIDSLIGFPEQVAEKLFAAAEKRQKFVDPGTGLRALQTFSKAYGSLVLSSLCLKSRYLLVSEKLEEIKSFQGLSCLDLSSCKLGDDHELLQHLTTEALSSLVKLNLGDNCLSDSGLRKMTAPVRVMKRGLKNLEHLDLSCNPNIGELGIGYLCCFKKLSVLDISGAGAKLSKSLLQMLQNKMGLVSADIPLQDFSHAHCKTEGWAEQVILQWDSIISDSAKPRISLMPRTVAQRFYGKETSMKRVLAPPSLAFNIKERKSEVNMQFHKKPLQDICSIAYDKSLPGKTSAIQNSKKRDLEILVQDNAVPSAKRQCARQLTLEDWDLLDSY
ncbi:UNVERIFIED_CONTAM: hypothetical protein FKN15_009138 [Acipenser sinensis]